MIKDNHETEITETNETTQPAPSLREVLKNNPKEVKDILKPIPLTSLVDSFRKGLQNNPPTSLIDNAIKEVENALLKLQETIQNSIDPLVLCIIEELTTFENKYPEILEVTVTDISQAISITERLDKSELKELYAELETLPEPEESTETNPALKYKKYLFKAVQRGRERYLADKGETNQKGFEKMLPTLQSVRPKWHTILIQKLASELQHELINNGAVDLIVANKGKKNEITSYVLATYDEIDAVISLSEFDRQVQDAVSSLWEHGHKDHIITPDMVVRTMTHKTQTEYISPHLKDAVTKSIEKMRRVHVTLDASDEVRKRNAILEATDTSCKIDDYLLSFKGIEISAGGKTVKGYLMQSEPLLLTYAKMTDQFATVDARLLDIKEVDQKGNVTTVSIKSSEARVAVNGYLLRRIVVMKNDRRTNKKPKQSNIILFDTLFEETGIPQNNNAKRVKDYAFQVLDYFIAMGYIKGYTKRKNRKSFDAVIIDL